MCIFIGCMDVQACTTVQLYILRTFTSLTTILQSQMKIIKGKCQILTQIFILNALILEKSIVLKSEVHI